MIMNIFALCCAVKVGSCWMHVENIQINWYLTCLLYVLIMWCQVNTWNMSHVMRVIISKMSFIWLCQKKNSRVRSIWHFVNSILQCIDSYYNLYKNTISEHRTHDLLLIFQQLYLLSYSSLYVSEDLLLFIAQIVYLSSIVIIVLGKYKISPLLNFDQA